MGTHPIFESDFDCLTDMSGIPPPNLPPPPPSNAKSPPSEIPTGPSPDKKEFTHGWNDPPTEIKKTDSNNPMRRKKKTSPLTPPNGGTTGFSTFNPTDSK